MTKRNRTAAAPSEEASSGQVDKADTAEASTTADSEEQATIEGPRDGISNFLKTCRNCFKTFRILAFVWKV